MSALDCFASNKMENHYNIGAKLNSDHISILSTINIMDNPIY